jgi:hypothetical protein
MSKVSESIQREMEMIEYYRPCDNIEGIKKRANEYLPEVCVKIMMGNA